MFARILRFLSSLPLMTLASFGALICGARHVLGHWPVPMINDPKHFDGSVLYDNLFDLFTTCLGLTIASLLLVIILLGWQWENNPKAARANTFLLALGWAGIILIGYFDPGRYVEWFID